MVLSNKKLKEKLRAAKGELLVARKISGEGPDSKTGEQLKTVLESVSQKLKASKREKRKKKVQSLQEKFARIEDEKREKDRVALEERKAAKRLKREQRRGKAQSLQENSASNADVAGESGSRDVNGEKEGGGSEELNEKKRKRKDDDGLESGQKVKKAVTTTPKTKKKKKKRKNKGKQDAGSEELKEDVKVREEEAAQAIQDVQLQEKVDVSTKVYVGGIPYYSNEDDIRSFFEACGTITGIDCMIFPDTGKFRGIAIITFKTEAAAKRALALDGSDMGGLFLKIQPYNTFRANKVANFSPEAVEGYNRIYIGNLSWEITEEDLRALFSGGQITSIRFGEDKETGEFKGYAHVDFADSVSLDSALKLDQNIVCGRPVRISCAVPKKGGVTKSRKTEEDTQVKIFDHSNPPQESSRVDAPPQESSRVDAPPLESSRVDAPPSNPVETVETNAALSAKIRRRTCYECGERGHLSSACPKKQGNEVAS